MRKGMIGVAAAALLTISFAGAASANDTFTIGDSAWVVDTDFAGDYHFINDSHDGEMLGALLDVNGVLTLDFAPADIDGAVVWYPGGNGETVYAPHSH